MQTTTVSNKVELRDVVLNLRKHAVESPVFSAMAHVFALRERTRQQIVVTTLFNTMLKEGFKFTKDEYRKELEYLANVGIGKIYKSSKGKTEALKNIGVTLQSIGLAAISKQDSLAKLRIANRFTTLPEVPVRASDRTPVQASAEVKPQPQPKPKPEPEIRRVQRPQPILQQMSKTVPLYKATLIIESDGTRREITLANKITAEKLLDVITALQGAK